MKHPKGSRDAALLSAMLTTRFARFSAHNRRAQPAAGDGLDPRYVRLVLKLLSQQRESGVYHPRLFEVGYGCGALLSEVSGTAMPSAASKYRESCAIKRSNFWASDMLARCC